MNGAQRAALLGSALTSLGGVIGGAVAGGFAGSVGIAGGAMVGG